MNYVQVRWVDSSLQNGQVDRHDFPKPEQITSIGILIDQTEDYITLARDDMGGGDYRGLLCIPSVAQLSVTPLVESDGKGSAKA